MKKVNAKQIFGATLGLISFVLAWVFYGWILALIIFLALWATTQNNEDTQMLKDKN